MPYTVSNVRFVIVLEFRTHLDTAMALYDELAQEVAYQAQAFLFNDFQTVTERQASISDEIVQMATKLQQQLTVALAQAEKRRKDIEKHRTTIQNVDPITAQRQLQLEEKLRSHEKAGQKIRQLLAEAEQKRNLIMRAPTSPRSTYEQVAFRRDQVMQAHIALDVEIRRTLDEALHHESTPRIISNEHFTGLELPVLQDRRRSAPNL